MVTLSFSLENTFSEVKQLCDNNNNNYNDDNNKSYNVISKILVIKNHISIPTAISLNHLYYFLLNIFLYAYSFKKFK